MWYTIVMKEVTLRDLKRNLSSHVAAASAGARIVITRHGRPVATLEEAKRRYLHVGARSTTGRLEPALDRSTRGKFLEILLEDRRGGNR